MGIVVTVEPTVEPVTNDELRAFLRLDDDFENDTLTRMETAARRTLEAWTNRAFVNTTYEYTLDYWPGGPTLALPMGPVSSVTSVQYFDSAAVEQTWGASNYQVDTTGVQGRIRLANGVSWPVLESEKLNAITVTFVAGYGAAASAVPENLRMAISALVGHWFENRIPVITGTIANDLPMHIRHMLTPESALFAY